MEKLHQYIQFYSHIIRGASCLSIAGLLATNINVNAQIIPDTTLPATTIVNSVGTNAKITGGTQFGVNLFHSFLQFSIDGTSITAADFVNPGVTNIISRVTGESISNINGLISAGNANLFLINPSGIIFGSNAQLQNVGSFIGTTADSLKFDDGNEFSAKNPAPPLLTMNIPVGLQFGQNPSSIIVQGIGQTQGFATQSFNNSLNPLQVAPDRTLALIGGTVQMNGGILQAPGGKIELAGIGSGGQIGLNPDFSLNLQDGIPLADISLSNGAAINALNSVTGEGGSISIYGQNINLGGGSLLSTGVAENLGISNGKAGDISLNAAGTVAIESSRIENNVNPGAAGDGGNINILAGALSLTNSKLDVALYGGGNAGNILIGVVNGVSLENSQLFSNVVGGDGSAGDIYILAGGLINILNSKLNSNAFSTGVAGNAGYIAILSPANSIAISNSQITTESNGSNSTNTSINNTFDPVSTMPGEIFILGKTISLLSNSELNASAGGSGYAGGINLFADDKVEIADSKIASDALSADQQSGGYSGFVGIGSGNSVSINNSSLTADSFGSANSEGFSSGMINIIGGNIAIINGSKLSTNILNDGVAGFVFITANDKFSLTNSTIQSNSQNNNPDSLGDAGNITIKARLVDLNQSTIEASSASGNGGGITFKVDDLVVLRNSSKIATNAGSQGNPGNGGFIDIDPLFVVGVNNSDITANSFNGAGGKITITATEGIFGLKVRSQLTPLNDITAFSQTNPQLNGTVEVFSPDVDPSTGLTTLSANFVDASSLVAQDICKPKKEESSFTITGRGGLPPNPYEIIAPDTTSIEWATRESENQRSVSPVIPNTNQKLPTKTKQIVEAQGLTIAPDGTVILTANPSTITPHDSGFTTPNCR
ncbi:two-partner secretion domain-containing protein [Limnofasciculus baicalensis]|uniref:Filamentous hemagglutinin N-terminal domain-containing protein n=1 Tax=Limnofasciculus baicalensis BBK-W-15 TaxID=2699891 RepID=A0AAE3GW05_9CYAN|nr:filamentous hemagglutinin N-terminal domain-containing protein [Limnofasciculus baicalensis]MCP2729592.1 filamentous hemagglutinin N-terminal domain-containing protein [Limnofasciculus baicalensis BBK-W-15]